VSACEKLFNDKRVITVFICIWSVLCAVVFYCIMAYDNSPFLNFGPSARTELFGVKLDSWPVWWAVAVYTFVSTAIAGYASDSIIPWITNTVQDHKTVYIPYSKFTCLVIIQVFTFYGVTQSMIGLFVALTQVDFMLIRLVADFLVNHYTTAWFLRSKQVNAAKYHEWERMKKDEHVDSDLESYAEDDFGLRDVVNYAHKHEDEAYNKQIENDAKFLISPQVPRSDQVPPPEHVPRSDQDTEDEAEMGHEQTHTQKTPTYKKALNNKI
jgi:hypothetical protein